MCPEWRSGQLPEHCLGFGSTEDAAGIGIQRGRSGSTGVGMGKGPIRDAVADPGRERRQRVSRNGKPVLVDAHGDVTDAAGEPGPGAG